MKWTAERSIDAIDLQLFDMFGQPLPEVPALVPTVPLPLGVENYVVTNGPGDYAITFLVEEQEDALVANASNYGYRLP